MNVTALKDDSSYSPSWGGVKVRDTLRGSFRYPLNGGPDLNCAVHAPESGAVGFYFYPPVLTDPVICCVQLWGWDDRQPVFVGSKAEGLGADHPLGSKTAAAIRIPEGRDTPTWVTFTGLGEESVMYEVWLENADESGDRDTLATIMFEVRA